MKITSSKILVATIATVMIVSMFAVLPINPAFGSSELPDYQAVDWRTSQAGLTNMPAVDPSDFGAAGAQEVSAFASTPPVGTKAYDWYLYAISRGTPTGTQPWMTLRAISGNVEIWTQDYLWFLPGDPRNADPLNLTITDAMCQFLADEFNDVIYPTDTTYFGAPFDRDGTNTIFELIGYPSYFWDWIATDNPQRVILKILNIRDTNYYDPSYPYYTAGFYSPTYTISYYNRNMIHIDAWRWWQRLGPAGTQWFSDRPDLLVNRPYAYDSTVAHEYQHNIHQDLQPADELFMNEGLSMYAELLCGFGIDPSYINSYLYTPDNSLTVWGDQGDINILADYGAAALWTIYLSDHYGGSDTIRYFVQSGIPGIDGVNAALAYYGYTATFDTVYHDWRIANLIHSDMPGGGRYNYYSLDLNDPDIIQAFNHTVSGLPVPPTKGTDFGTTMTILGYDTGVSKLGAYGSDYIVMNEWGKMGVIYFDGDDTAVYGWTMTTDGWWSNGENLMDALLYGSAYVDPANPTLEIVTAYDAEYLWDFAFVQVSTDGGMTWTSQANAYTTMDHDPSAHPAIIANLPGLTGTSDGWPGWLTMTFDLTAYAGQTVLVGFRYMTDWATLGAGWYINSATVSGTPMTLTPVYPDADFQVSLVRVYVTDGVISKYLVNDMSLNDATEQGSMGVTVGRPPNPNYVILVVSYVSQKGSVDYTFQAKTVPGRLAAGYILAYP